MNETQHFFEEWVRYTCERLAHNLQKQGVQFSEGSAKDFVKTRIEQRVNGYLVAYFTFRMSGRFIDMGVGKGTSFAESRKGTRSTSSTQQDKRHKRTRKNWYSTTMYGRIHWLQEAISAQIIEEYLPELPKLPPTLNV
ncbi:hypothetical protein [Siphonobacter sp.]|uniref:hypothetical protein n=1 Tax=Siphonobacter sp. TaxID=1869184 RepID=UPI003B3A6C9D